MKKVIIFKRFLNKNEKILIHFHHSPKKAFNSVTFSMSFSFESSFKWSFIYSILFLMVDLLILFNITFSPLILSLSPIFKHFTIVLTISIRYSSSFSFKSKFSRCSIKSISRINLKICFLYPRYKILFKTKIISLRTLED